ncbi:MAG: hypothetical protein KatS3mg102_0097 [Planctomycetota bacterium]|nr:MAG: hypothetical protein KatS3mg102_0097 [Planctomycetota bacterium]
MARTPWAAVAPRSGRAVDEWGEAEAEGAGRGERRAPATGAGSGGVSGALGALGGALSGAISTVLGRPLGLEASYGDEQDAEAARASLEVFRRWASRGALSEPPNAVVRMTLEKAGLALEDCPRPRDCPPRIDREGATVTLPPLPRAARRLWRRVLASTRPLAIREVVPAANRAPVLVAVLALAAVAALLALVLWLH